MSPQFQEDKPNHQNPQSSSPDDQNRTPDLDAWKERPPYQIHTSANDFKAVWNGKCHCGKTRYQLSRDRPLSSKYCHCTTCQRLHGAPFQWAAIFHKTDINFTQGHHDLSWYDPSERSTRHKLPCKVSCSYCRTPIMDEGRRMILLFPGLIEGINTPEGRQAFEAECHMFYGRRVVDVKDGKDKWEGLAGDSRRMDQEGIVIEEEDGEGEGDGEREGRARGNKRQKIESGSE